MFKHSLLLIYRNFLRFKSSFFINLVGLSTGLACTLAIYLWVNDELHIDKFHEKDDQLYQAMLQHHNTGDITTSPATPALLAETLVDEMPQIEYAVATTSGIEMPLFLLSVDDKSIKAAGQFVGESFFNMFSYNLTEGDRNEVLSDKNSIVISEELAIKLFNTTQNIIGKPVVFEQDKQFVISGIFKGTPPNSSDQFDFLLSFEVFRNMIGPSHRNWGNTGPRTFVLLRESADVDDFNTQIAGFIKSKESMSNAEVFLRPFSDRYLYNNYENGVQAGGRIEYVRLFSIIALFILVIACINFMNLSTAKASRRIKEVGVKKAIGASRKSLILQYLAETLLMTLLSLSAAIILVQLILPQFNEITGKQLQITFDTKLVLSLLCIILFTGLLAGSYPALYLSGFSPAKVLKGKHENSLEEVWARKGLVVFQFTLSVILIVAVMVVYMQIEYVQTQNLGFSKDNVIYLPNEGKVEENLDLFLSEVKNIPGVINASSSAHSFIGQQTSTAGLHWEGKIPDEVIPFELARVNYGMIETLGIEMAAGRSFSKDFRTDSTKVVFNEAAIKAMGLKDPIGKAIKAWGEDMQIIGVAKDFHFQPLHEEVKPLFFILKPEDSYHIMIKLEAGKEQDVIHKLQEFYTVFNPGYTFDYKFLDATYQAQYEAEQRVSILSRYFAGLAIMISCLGLFGLAAFTAQRRRKEISIRKIHGSSNLGIVYLLSSDFTMLVLTAILIAMPLSYLLVREWLDGFAYRIELELWYFIVAGLTALVVAWLTVGVQALKAAHANPTQYLKDE